MYKIKKIHFYNHPILNNLELDFCDDMGNPVDTIILAGENGCGKSTVLNELYKIVIGNHPVSNSTEYLIDDNIFTVKILLDENNKYHIHSYDENGYNINLNLPAFSGIFSDVDINFHSNDIRSVTSMTLDDYSRAKRSNENLSTSINQLLIDIQALDDSEVAKKVRDNSLVPYTELNIEERMNRFKKAFNIMFDDLEYSHVDNKNNKKIVYFKRNDYLIPIENLSSGEKQIVYRGSFLLKDKNALNGAFVFIDEPEISLHPIWQNKIMSYYKNIFTDDLSIQTSQIFVATHSPFIIHNNRYNDKVIILKRDDHGYIKVSNNPEFYSCNSMDIVKEAFNINIFDNDDQVVYLEGRTDEKYFNKALQVFNYEVNFQFQWIGHLDDNGQEVNTGDSALSKAYQFLVGRNNSSKKVCLFDCDTHRKDMDKNNVFIRTVKFYENKKNIRKGIENALCLDTIDLSSYYTTKDKMGEYGEINKIQNLEKMDLCDYICSLDNEKLTQILKNIKIEIDKLIDIFS